MGYDAHFWAQLNNKLKLLKNSEYSFKNSKKKCEQLKILKFFKKLSNKCLLFEKYVLEYRKKYAILR